MTNKFIAGLPPQLAFFVRAGRVSSIQDALQSAKIGQAHGYRQSQGPPVVVLPVSTSTVNAGSDSGSNYNSEHYLNQDIISFPNGHTAHGTQSSAWPFTQSSAWP